MIFYTALAFTGIALIGFIVTFGAIQYRKFQQDMRYLYWYFVYDFATSLLSVVIAYQQTNNHWISQLQIPFLYCWFVYIMSRWVQQKYFSRFMLYSIPFLLLLWGVVSVLNPDVWTMFDIVSFPVAFILLILFSLIVIFETMKETHVRVTDLPQFWFSAGLLLISITTLTSLAFARQLLIVSSETLMLVWAIRNCISIIAYICFTVGFFRGRTHNVIFSTKLSEAG